YLRRQDVQYPQQANSNDNYGIKVIEADTTTELQAAVNAFLFALPAFGSNDWYPHVVSTQYDNYSSQQGPPSITHVCVITVYVSGNLLTPFSG
ncbi:MAG TPA: hypothetical protein VMV42_00165, partial [archaeon]|nr:hypothetical protein [archaeon]